MVSWGQRDGGGGGGGGLSCGSARGFDLTKGHHHATPRLSLGTARASALVWVSQHFRFRSTRREHSPYGARSQTVGPFAAPLQASLCRTQPRLHAVWPPSGTQNCLVVSLPTSSSSRPHGPLQPQRQPTPPLQSRSCWWPVLIRSRREIPELGRPRRPVTEDSLRLRPGAVKHVAPPPLSEHGALSASNPLFLHPIHRHATRKQVRNLQLFGPRPPCGPKTLAASQPLWACFCGMLTVNGYNCIIAFSPKSTRRLGTSRRRGFCDTYPGTLDSPPVETPRVCVCERSR